VAKPLPSPGDARSHPPQPPAFKYQALVENSVLVRRVLEMALAAKVTITNKELCALVPEIRKWYRDNTATKRIPTVVTGTFAEWEALIMNYHGIGKTRSMLLTTSLIDSLCVLDFFVNDARSVTCMLNQGSEIMAMNRDIWQDLGVALSLDKILTMELADSGRSTTAGVVENLKFSVREIDVLLQVQVVDGAPFDILMGRPFF
jgi:hypothetical protein